MSAQTVPFRTADGTVSIFGEDDVTRDRLNKYLSVGILSPEEVRQALMILRNRDW